MLWQIHHAGLHEQVTEPRVRRGTVAVRHATGNPYPALWRDDPQCVFHLTGDGPMQGQDQLTFAMIVDRDLRRVLGYLQALGHGGPIRHIRVDVEAGDGNGRHYRDRI